MPKTRKTWREKLEETGEKNGLPRVVEVNEKMSKKWGEGTCIIPAPLEVDGIMRLVPAGRLITINLIRETLAKRYQASFG
jgi:hypothetical protein